MGLLEAASGLQRLPAFGTWQVDAAEAEWVANTRLQTDLGAHVDDATSVGRAAAGAADGIEKVQRDLRQLRWDAEDLGMEIEPASSRIVPGRASAVTPSSLLPT